MAPLLLRSSRVRARTGLVAGAALLVACGRVGFDPAATGPGTGEAADARGSDGAPGDGPGRDGGVGACSGDLSNVGDGDFSIAFTLTTTSVTKQALLYQRGQCGVGPGYWEVHLGDAVRAGQPVLELHDGANSSSMPVGSVVADGSPHAIEFRRIAGAMTAFVDGVPGNQARGTVVELPAALPPLGVLTGHPCALTPLVGVLTDVCIRPL